MLSFKLIRVISYRKLNIRKQKTNQTVVQQVPHLQNSTYHKINYMINQQTSETKMLSLYAQYSGKILPSQKVSILSKIMYLSNLNKSPLSETPKLLLLLKHITYTFEKMPPQSLIKFIHATRNQPIPILRICLSLIKRCIAEFNNPEHMPLMSPKNNFNLLKAINQIRSTVGKQIEDESLATEKKIMTYLKSKVKQLESTDLMVMLKICKDTRISNLLINTQIISQLLRRHKFLSMQKLLKIQRFIVQNKQLRQKTLEYLSKSKQHDNNLLIRTIRYIGAIYNTNFEETQSNVLVQHFQYLLQLKNNIQQSIYPVQQEITSQLYNLLKHSLHYFSVYQTENYKGQVQKAKIIKWVTINTPLIHKLIIFADKFTHQWPKQHTNQQFRKFMNTLCQFFTHQTLETQLSIIKIILNRKYSNSSQIIKIFQQSQQNHIAGVNKNILAQYNQLYQYPQFTSTLNISWNKFLIKSLLVRFQQDDFERICCLLCEHCLKSEQAIQLVLEIYLKVSDLNRCFNKNDIQVIIEHQKQMAFIKRPSTFRQDRDYLHHHYNLRQKIMKKINICIKSFSIVSYTFIKMMAKGIKFKQTIPTSILQDQLIQQILKNFKDQLKCLKFQGIFSYQNVQRLSELQRMFQIDLNCVSVQQYNRKKLEQPLQMHKQKSKIITQL